MQNPEKYKTPAELGAAGGWTYNTDWRKNTNFLADAVGQWQLTLTPEVMASWKPDTSRPETYASYWTPEAVMRRSMMATASMNARMDSINGVTGSNTSGSTATASADASTNGATMSASGSGTTGTVGTGGATMNANAGMNSMDSAGTASTMLTAVNGNNFLMPRLNLYIENGSFTGYTGCNNIIGNVTVTGNSLHFQNLMPTSSIQCNGGFDQTAYIDRLSRADSYDMVNGQIRLKQGDQVLMVLSKASQ
jgi:hypothetical protein